MPRTQPLNLLTLASLMAAVVLSSGCSAHNRFPQMSQSLAADQDAVCAKAAARLAPGMTVNNTVINAPLTAAQASGEVGQFGDSRGAVLWASQRPDTPVYTCNFAGPLPTSQPSIWNCPAGQIMQDNGGPTRTFLVDAAGHATEFPGVQAEPSCAPG